MKPARICFSVARRPASMNHVFLFILVLASSSAIPISQDYYENTRGLGLFPSDYFSARPGNSNDSASLETVQEERVDSAQEAEGNSSEVSRQTYGSSSDVTDAGTTTNLTDGGDTEKMSSSASTKSLGPTTARNLVYSNATTPGVSSLNTNGSTDFMNSTEPTTDAEKVITPTKKAVEPSYVEIFRHTLVWLNDTYTLSILIPVCGGFVFASVVIVTIATCRCLRRRCYRRRLRKKVLPESVKNMRRSDRKRLLADTSDDEF